MRALRVLVVEDGEKTSALVRQLGHVPLPGGDLERAAAWNPDVAIVDLVLPSLDGVEFAKRFRLTPETAETPLVAMTGYMDVEYRRQAIDAGFDEFLAVPFHLNELSSILIRVEARIIAAKAKIDQSRDVAEAARIVNRRAQDGLAEYRRSKGTDLQGTARTIRAIARADGQDQETHRRQATRLHPIAGAPGRAVLCLGCRGRSIR